MSALAVVTLVASGALASQPAAEHTEDPLVRVRAISMSPSAMPGQRVEVGIHFEIADGWHTYWPGQNDTGFGTTIEVKAPEGVQVSGPHWPAPKRHVAPGDILDHVHEGSVTPIFYLNLPQGLEIGSTITIDFDLAWLVCKEMCIPGWESLSLSIPVTQTDAPPQTEGRILAEARARIPDWRRPTRIQLDGSTASITRPGATAIAFYPDEASGHVRDLLNAGYAEGDTLTLTVEGDDPRLSGVLEVWRGPDQPSTLEQITSGAIAAPESPFE
ncbi:MAG: hypothetical protein D6692_06560 [Planctomycetota bacterium]|nr:MAG: hypothetical protein D6692_06560 [Planctomycetota bacterium]